MTASEARELTAGSMKRKGLWFKWRLTWICGVINKCIEHDAERGNIATKFTTSKEALALQYYPIMKKLFEGQGFKILLKKEYSGYGSYEYGFYVFWDWDSLSDGTKKEHLRCSYDWTRGMKDD